MTTVAVSNNVPTATVGLTAIPDRSVEQSCRVVEFEWRHQRLEPKSTLEASRSPSCRTTEGVGLLMTFNIRRREFRETRIERERGSVSNGRIEIPEYHGRVGITSRKHSYSCESVSNCYPLPASTHKRSTMWPTSNCPSVKTFILTRFGSNLTPLARSLVNFISTWDTQWVEEREARAGTGRIQSR